MSLQSNEANPQERLSQIDDQAAQLHRDLQSTLGEIRNLGRQLREAAQGTREAAAELANLRAEARLICLTNGFELPDVPALDSHLEVAKEFWNDVAANLRPVSPSDEWVDKIRRATISRPEGAVLTEEESEDLRSRLEEMICPLCVNHALDGSCTLEAFNECPITAYQDRVVVMIQQMGHSPWMEDYFQKMYKDICPLCRDKSAGGVCVPREEGDCALFSYLPAIVKTVEEFMKERAEKR